MYPWRRLSCLGNKSRLLTAQWCVNTPDPKLGGIWFNKNLHYCSYWDLLHLKQKKIQFARVVARDPMRPNRRITITTCTTLLDQYAIMMPVFAKAIIIFWRNFRPFTRSIQIDDNSLPCTKRSLVYVVVLADLVAVLCRFTVSVYYRHASIHSREKPSTTSVPWRQVLECLTTVTTTRLRTC